MDSYIELSQPHPPEKYHANIKNFLSSGSEIIYHFTQDFDF